MIKELENLARELENFSGGNTGVVIKEFKGKRPT